MVQLRSALFFAWMVVTVIPIAITALLMSIFVRGERLYGVCIFFLRLAVAGARPVSACAYATAAVPEPRPAPPLTGARMPKVSVQVPGSTVA